VYSTMTGDIVCARANGVNKLKQAIARIVRFMASPKL